MDTCTKCKRVLPTDSFSKASGRRSGHKSWCKECCSARTRQWAKEKRAADKDWAKGSDLRQKYGMTLDDFTAMWNVQGGCCLICRTPLRAGSAGHAVDHCHSSGIVRGLLCHACNTGIGKFRDDPRLLREAANYLDSTSSPKAVAA